MTSAEELLEFVQACPSMFHTAAEIRRRLEEAGFAFLSESDPWDVRPGGCYYTVRNNSSVVAFKVGAHCSGPGNLRFMLEASHSDAPTFKIKAVPGIDGPENYGRLSVEAYGGAIDYTWFDRPLAVAGRVMVRNGSRVESRLVATSEPVALIPSLAHHLQRGVNEGFAPNRAIDLCPLFSQGSAGGQEEQGSVSSAFLELVAREAGVDADQILGHDLYLVNLQAPCIWGPAREFVSAPKLDDLMCAFTSLKAFVASENARSVTVFCCFDNEEVGSGTKQGAKSTLLADTLQRLSASLGASAEDYRRALAKSMLVSCDNAQAVHPAHPEKYDAGNRCLLNGGIVVKEAANQHYCTDAFSRAVFAAILDDAGVPRQEFANRSDMQGGSTLGNLSNIQASVHAVDVGCPQLAMHSSYETAGALDVDFAIRALSAFYTADLRIEGADAAELA